MNFPLKKMHIRRKKTSVIFYLFWVHLCSNFKINSVWICIRFLYCLRSLLYFKSNAQLLFTLARVFVLFRVGALMLDFALTNKAWCRTLHSMESDSVQDLHSAESDCALTNKVQGYTVLCTDQHRTQSNSAQTSTTQCLTVHWLTKCGVRLCTD